MTTQSITAICAVLGIARRSAYYVARARLAGRYQRASGFGASCSLKGEPMRIRGTHSVRSVATALDTTPWTIRRMIKLGRIQAVRPPWTTQWRITDDELKRLLEGGGPADPMRRGLSAF
jgi:excisionase family DNA binding protein